MNDQDPRALSMDGEPVPILPDEPLDGLVLRRDEQRSLAVLTSGGDSQGMNAAIRSIVRVALWHGMRAYAVREGYQGLVDGGKFIKELHWGSVSNILQCAGTVFGTGRSAAFMTREGRLKAAENLVKLRISNVVVIGGNGSLEGANVFKEEWRGIVEELVRTERVTEEDTRRCSYLNILGLVGTVDNDVCGTDMSIGADSALHRITDAIDCITTTAASHQRSFVLEVMGMDCGYLAQMAAIAGGADWVIIPENPPHPGWEERMCKKLSQCRQLGRRLSLVVIAQGAVDIHNRPIESKYVKEVIMNSHVLEYETRLIVLGHIQRGGMPSAYDRIMATQEGAAAALLLTRAKEEIPPQLIAVQGNVVVTVPLKVCVKRTRAIEIARKACDFKQLLELKSDGFRRNLKLSHMLTYCSPLGYHSDPELQSSPKYRFAIINIGAPAAGINSAVRAFARLMQYRGHTVLGIFSGIDGLLKDSIRKLTWEEVGEWHMEGGSRLIANRRVPEDHEFPKIAAKLAEHMIQGLVVIAGFEGYQFLDSLARNRELHPQLRIPVLGIAATISNSVPGTEYSLGSDTALNMIISSCDILRQSASSSNKRVFVVETFGRYCGYLATVGGLAAGADAAFIFEKEFTITDLEEVAASLVAKFHREGEERGLLVRNEKCNEIFTCEFMEDLLAKEGKGTFTVRINKLGHLQDGYRPSPYDRVMGVKFASHAVEHLIRKMESRKDGYVQPGVDAESVCMLGIHGNKIETTPIQALIANTDFEHRISKEPQRWLDLYHLLHALARHKDQGLNETPK